MTQPIDCVCVGGEECRGDECPWCAEADLCPGAWTEEDPDGGEA